MDSCFARRSLSKSYYTMSTTVRASLFISPARSRRGTGISLTKLLLRFACRSLSKSYYTTNHSLCPWLRYALATIKSYYIINWCNMKERRTAFRDFAEKNKQPRVKAGFSVYEKSRTSRYERCPRRFYIAAYLQTHCAFAQVQRFLLSGCCHRII